MPNGVYAPVHAMKPPLPHAPIDRVFTETKRDELSARYHPVLPPRKVRNRPVDGVLRSLTVHYAVK